MDFSTKIYKIGLILDDLGYPYFRNRQQKVEDLQLRPPGPLRRILQGRRQSSARLQIQTDRRRPGGAAGTKKLHETWTFSCDSIHVQRVSAMTHIEKSMLKIIQNPRPFKTDTAPGPSSPHIQRHGVMVGQPAA